MTALILENLETRHPALTSAMAAAFYEAASVCFDRHHSKPSQIDVYFDDSRTITLIADWLDISPTMVRTYANTIDTTEWGAYGVSFAAIEWEGLVAIHRAETMSGADFYVAPEGSDPDDLENAVRLEVSGTDAGTRSTCRQRLKAKVDQTKKAKHSVPAIASVVGFSEKIVLVSGEVEP